MNKIFRVILCLQLCLTLQLGLRWSSVYAQTSDPVVMTINGKPILLSEFEYSFRKNNGDDVVEKKSVEEYVELFLNFRRMVEAALDARLDTMTSYNKEFRMYRDSQVQPTLINDDDVEKEAQRIYNNTKERIGADGFVNPHHILVRLPQNADDAAKAAAEQLADSIYNALKNGADFMALAKEKSQDIGSAPNGGNIGWISKGQTLKAFEETAFSLKDGEISKPVLSEVGYHIIKMGGHKDLEPYDTLRADIYSYIEKRKIRESIAKNRLKDIAALQGKTTEQVMDERSDSISALDMDMKYLIKEYHDGLLRFEIEKIEVWDKAANDEAGLAAYYKKNKKKYVWDAPRYKGIAYRTRNVDDVNEVKKTLKGKKFGEWAKILRTTFNNDSVLRIRAEKGVFKKGDNALIDREVFGVADAKVKNIMGFPNTAVFGKLIKGPEEMSDVKAVLIGDYQNVMEQQWLKELEKRYPAEVNWDIVKTIKEK